jgi:hypothetical protein
MNELTHQTEEALKAIRAKVAHRREYLNILEMELYNTRQALQEFNNQYRTRLGTLELELNRLERILDDNISTQESEQKSSGSTKAKEEQEGKDSSSAHSHKPKNKLKSTKNPDYERKVREIFRNLAKRFHPDLTNDKDEKKRREEIMAKINQAYTSRDLELLQELAQDSEIQSNNQATGPDEEYMRFKIELRQLETMIFEVEHTIRELDTSPVMQMRTEAKTEENAGRDMLGNMEFDLKLRIAELREHLLDLGLEV